MMQDPNAPPKAKLDERLYRWLPEIDSLRTGMAHTLRDLKAEGAPDEQQSAARDALAHLDYAIRALEWVGWYEIPIAALGQGDL
jgi:hypothetical protein